MIHANQLAFGLLFGCALILFGLVPDLFNRFVEGVRSLQQFADPPRTSHTPLPQPTWLAGVGALLITAALLAYFSK
ncbi:MAG TPA: hypothetical protein DEQ47_17725 [Solibacterales bacterium]|nr:hypothetical protein [Bryobacterales bacterium]